ncbi:MAG: dihydroorotate dehydrogenase (quinone) [Candidatus Paceibacterota bacterium]
MIGLIYRKIIKPTLFLFPADDVHTFFLKTGNFLGRFSFTKILTSKIFSYKNKSLSQNFSEIYFENPIGLAAGFDYDADLIDILPSVGFGFHTIGTVTNLPYVGNQRPMLGRLPKSKSLLVNKGFKSEGINKVLEKVKKVASSAIRRKGGNKIPLGISIGSTNKNYKDIEEMAGDIIVSFQRVLKEDYFTYFELNISCPNLINTENLPEKFDTPNGLNFLLSKLEKLQINRPLFIKMYLEKSVDDTLALCEVATKYEYVSGFIFSNLVKDRKNPAFNKEEIENAGRGNFSGKPTEKITNNLISEVYKKYGHRFIVIGCGGVFNGDDAYEKIKRGATLIQLITGMIYEGPSVIGKINKELAELLKKDGYKNVNEAVGSYYK